MKIAGLDIGTTGCKCTVFDGNGTYLDKAYRDYPVHRGGNGHEVDAQAILDGVYAVLGEVAAKHKEIAGIGVTSFGETFVMTDAAGVPLHPAMLYTDPRGAEECAKLTEQFRRKGVETENASGTFEKEGDEEERKGTETEGTEIEGIETKEIETGGRRIAEITGLRPHEMYSISKMMWMKKYRPELYQKAAYLFLIEDFVVYHLTGKRQIDYSLASRTMAFDINTLSWSDEILSKAGIEKEKLSMPVPSGTDAGCITEQTAKRTGLSVQTHIISVGHDQVAAAIGAGAFDPSVAVDGAGTVECITPIFDAVPDVDVMYNGYFSIVPYVIPGRYVAYAFSYTGGALIQWCVETIAKKEKEMADYLGISVNTYLERESAGPTGLLVLPHFAGAATPYMDTGSKGAILGLTMDTTAAQIYRACMEGVVYEMRMNVNALDGSGASFTKLRATGGGAKSEEWMQMKADMLDLPITALKTVDAGTVGSAMLTGIAVGLFEDLRDAAAYMVEEGRTYLPRKEMHEAYIQVFERYKNLYTAVRGFYDAAH